MKKEGGRRQQGRERERERERERCSSATASGGDDEKGEGEWIRAVEAAAKQSCFTEGIEQQVLLSLSVIGICFENGDSISLSLSLLGCSDDKAATATEWS
jgi:hypothetical protein